MNDMILRIPATRDWTLVLRMALSGVGALADLPIDLLDDLRTAADEAFDLLTHQELKPQKIAVTCIIRKKELQVSLRAEDRDTAQSCLAPDCDVAQQILSTLLKSVELEIDEHGVYGVLMTLPSAGA